MAEFGIRAIIAPSFGAIFRANCIANGLLPICLEADFIQQLADWVEEDPQANRLQIDLDQRSVGASQELLFQFEMDDSDAEMLLHGLDPIALTLRLEDQIRDFQQSDKQNAPLGLPVRSEPGCSRGGRRRFAEPLFLQSCINSRAKLAWLRGDLLQGCHGVTMLKVPVGLSSREKKRSRSSVLPSTSRSSDNSVSFRPALPISICTNNSWVNLSVASAFAA